jgi:hypothetical protein
MDLLECGHKVFQQYDYFDRRIPRKRRRCPKCLAQVAVAGTNMKGRVNP